MDFRVRQLLKIIKAIAIIVAVVAIFIIWTIVPEDEFNEIEVNHAHKQSK